MDRRPPCDARTTRGPGDAGGARGRSRAADRIDGLAGRAGEQIAERLRDYLDSLSQRTRQELGGVRDRLAVLGESELGGRLEPDRGFRELDLEGMLRSRGVAYFRLDSDRYPLAAEMLGAAIVSDLVNLTGHLQSAPMHGLVVVDEFAAVAADEVSRLLGRSRSAGLSVVVATQTFAGPRPGASGGFDREPSPPGDGQRRLRDCPPPE